jgi:hypothetical protein
MSDKNLVDTFKVMVVEDRNKLSSPTSLYVKDGFVTDFRPTTKQLKALTEVFRPIPVTTLFTVEERKNSDPWDLIEKQLLHYYEVYGLESPGLFNLEVTKGKIIVLGFVKGISKDELETLVQGVIYKNAPFAKLKELKEIIDEYKIPYDFDKIQNNEMKTLLYRDGKDTFTQGDDAVRYMVYKATDETLMIKSKEVIQKLKLSKLPVSFLQKHEVPLARVWNRHKKLIMSVKNKSNKTVINKISRLSKTHHIPIKEAINKTFVGKALKDYSYGFGKGVTEQFLKNIPLRDKLKYLNLLEWKKLNNPDDVYIIRNGKIHFKKNVKQYSKVDIQCLIDNILTSITGDLSHLQGKNILLDGKVIYGLPTSQKQMFGNLPFGTQIMTDGKTISSGVYWKNDWGATDLDLSAVDEKGQRTGWGQYSAYDQKNPIAFSGDITNAPTGAMEFLTSDKKYKGTYGLYVNIFSGQVGCSVELVIGNQTDTKWIKDPLIREKTQLRSHQNIIGFVRDGMFIVYNCRMGGGRTSNASKQTEILIQKGLAPMWTVERLFTNLGVPFDTVADATKKYDYDLTYSNFTIDKLEKMLYK